MKRFLLLISAMLVMSGMMAQDVYYSGYYTNGGQKYATVYKNNTKLHQMALGTSDCESTSVAIDPATNDVYWVRNSASYGDVFKNGNIYLNNATGTHINNIFWSNYTNYKYAYAAGYKTTDGVKYATIWKGTDSTPYLQPNNGNGKESEAKDVVYVQTGEGTYYSYYCGYANATTTGSPRATVWKGSSVLYTLSDVNSCAMSIAYYDGHVYTAGYVMSGSNKVIKVWKDNNVLYTLTDASANAYVYKIVVDCGDVYVVGWGTLRNQYVWKNGVMLSDMSSGGYSWGLDVNSSGYYVGKTTSSNVSSVYMNGTPLYSSIAECEMIYDLVVTEKPADNSVRTLPYTENFEIGETDWTSWTKIDGDGAFSTQLAYWHRAGDCSMAASGGEYCARHRGDGTSQTGWLITPRMFLQPGRDYTILQFINWSGTDANKSVWVSTNSDPTATSSYTKVWENNSSQSWSTVTVDLSAYQGELVYIAFKYEGTGSGSGATWLIDNVSVTEDWENPSPYEAPYTQDFSASATHPEPGYCWYIIDYDMSGGKYCWKNSSDKAYHPWGPQNIYQVGFMFSPSIDLAAGHNYHLTFDTQNSSSGSNMSSEVWISTIDTGTPNPSNYTTKLWQESTSSSTHTVDIDLSAYAGQTVRFCFAYRGTYAHAWYVDNFSVTSNDAVNEVGEVILSVYPNPTTESFRINGLEQEVEVNIYNVTGALMKTVVVNGAEEINVSELPAGLYMARFGETTLKFTKE
ncbi:MAG: choice-of-anchor J domain-containing protein [Bacteroidales bacterium]|nr:choice-of-anchor J domain-containing protein [Bacteroidales bacterium]